MPGTRWPNLFVVGAAKSGTTSLYASLAAHPQIFMSPLKEPHFFSAFDVDRRTERLHGIVRDEGRYLELFASAGSEPVVGEASTSYLWDPAAPARIAEVSPAARIVAILRHPVERAYSHYLNDVREGLEARRFHDAVSDELAHPEAARWPSVYVGFGRYGEQLARYLDRFPEVLVLFFEEYVADPRGQTRRVLEFLGVDAERVTVETRPANAYARPRNELARRLFGLAPVRLAARALVPRPLRPAGRTLVWTRGEKPPLDPPTRALLEVVYRPEIRRVGELLGTRPPW